MNNFSQIILEISLTPFLEIRLMRTCPPGAREYEKISSARDCLCMQCDSGDWVVRFRRETGSHSRSHTETHRKSIAIRYSEPVAFGNGFAQCHGIDRRKQKEIAHTGSEAEFGSRLDGR
ncbi:MAG: hypothetical protein ABR611_14150 [Chthoniobacterales bacterium]